MSLPSVALEFSSITSDRTSGVITDNTVFTSPARSGGAVFFEVDKMDFESAVSEILAVVGNDNNPETDTSWTFTVSARTVLKDGWTRGKYVFIVDYAGGTTYALYDAVFRPSTGAVYRSKQAGNVGQSLDNTTYWEVIALPADLALNEGETNESANIASQVYDIEVTATAELAFANQIAIASTEGGDAVREQSVQLYELLAVMVDGIYVLSDRSQFAQGERIARRVETIATENGLI